MLTLRWAEAAICSATRLLARLHRPRGDRGRRVEPRVPSACALFAPRRPPALAARRAQRGEQADATARHQHAPIRNAR